MVLANQPAMPCFHGPELAGAQQIMDEFPGDAQQVSGLLRAVGEPLVASRVARYARPRPDMGLDWEPSITADIACRDDRGAVTVGNEAPVWQDRCPAGQSRLLMTPCSATTTSSATSFINADPGGTRQGGATGQDAG